MSCCLERKEEDMQMFKPWFFKKIISCPKFMDDWTLSIIWIKTIWKCKPLFLTGSADSHNKSKKQSSEWTSVSSRNVWNFVLKLFGVTSLAVTVSVAVLSQHPVKLILFCSIVTCWSPPHTHTPSTPHSVCLSFLVVHQGAAVNQKAAQSLTPTSLRAAPVTASIIRPPAQTLQR